MENLTLEVGAAPRVRIPAVGSDLRVVGRPGTSLEAQAPSKGDLQISREGDGVQVSARGGCLLFLPADARLEIGAVGGDARLSGLSGETTVGTIGGDLNLRDVGAVRLGRVGGDVRLLQARGPLNAEWIGGDGRLENLTAGLSLQAVEGDLYIRNAAGEVKAAAHGDVHAELVPASGTHSILQALGDMLCRLPSDASVVVSYDATGDVSLAVPGRYGAARGQGAVQLGGGEAGLELKVSGDLLLEAQGGTAAGGRDWRMGLGTRIDAQVDAALAELEQAERLGTIPGMAREDIAERIRQSLKRARRRWHHPGRHFGADRPDEVNISLGSVGAGETAEVTDEERLSILRMVQEGTISVEDAERLFRAMEGNE